MASAYLKWRGKVQVAMLSNYVRRFQTRGERWSPSSLVHTNQDSIHLSRQQPTTTLPPEFTHTLFLRKGHLASPTRLPYTHQVYKEGLSSFVRACQPCSTVTTCLEVEDSSHHHSLLHHADRFLSNLATNAPLRQLHTIKSLRDTVVEACVVLQRLPVQAAPCSCALRRVQTTALPLETFVLSAHRTSHRARMARMSTSSSMAASSSVLALYRSSLVATSV